MITACCRRALLVASLALLGLTPALWANSGFTLRDPFCVQPRGATVGTAFLVEYFQALPEPTEDETAEEYGQRLDRALQKFRQQVEKRYTEGTLQRLLETPDRDARRGATLALGMTGTMRVNADLAARLRDGDPMVRRLAADAMWSIWYRADSDENNKELQRLIEVRDPKKAIAGFTELIKKAPNFAEAYNQRAIRYYQAQEFQKSADDCAKVLQLNPHHFGAMSGLAQCLMNLRQFPEALNVYRKVYKLNPHMAGVEDAIRMLENALGDDRKK
jgi:tetratricopeptide (TPR) repeat protein